MHTNRDMVVIVQADQVAKFQMAGSTSSLAGNTLHSTSISEDAVCVVIEQVVSWSVENGSRMGLGNSKTNSIGNTLTEGSGCDLDSGGVVSFRVTGSDTAKFLSVAISD